MHRAGLQILVTSASPYYYYYYQLLLLLLLLLAHPLRPRSSPRTRPSPRRLRGPCLSLPPSLPTREPTNAAPSTHLVSIARPSLYLNTSVIIMRRYPTPVGYSFYAFRSTRIASFPRLALSFFDKKKLLLLLLLRRKGTFFSLFLTFGKIPFSGQLEYIWRGG